MISSSITSYPYPFAQMALYWCCTVGQDDPTAPQGQSHLQTVGSQHCDHRKCTSTKKQFSQDRDHSQTKGLQESVLHRTSAVSLERHSRKLFLSASEPILLQELAEHRPGQLSGMKNFPLLRPTVRTLSFREFLSKKKIIHEREKGKL